MLRLSTIADLETLERPLHLALGVFDGVHIGHQAVIGAAVAGAEESGGVAGVLTFEPHPIQILAPDRAPRRILSSLEHKERLLEGLGVTVFLVLEFTSELAQQPAGEFAAGLVAAPTLRQLSAGEDWKFGRQRAGTVALLESLGAREGVMVSAISSVMMDGERVSSTRLRQALRDGNLKAAAAMLGRPYAVMGAVERGAQLGRALGFPTANIAVGDEQLPPDGVYAVVVTATGEDRPGLANLGVRPTVSGERRLLEVHLLNFEGDLYGVDVEVRFGRRLRGEKKYADVDALKEQILCDVAAARALFDEGEAMVC